MTIECEYWYSDVVILFVRKL